MMEVNEENNQIQLDDGSFLDIGEPTPLEKRAEEVFGLTPNIDRPTFIPLPMKQEDGSRKLTAPVALYEPLKFITSALHVFKGGGITEEEIINFGLTFSGAGVASRVGKKSVDAVGDIIKTKKGKELTEKELDTFKTDGVYHSDTGGLPVKKKTDLTYPVKYDPYYSTDNALKIRFNEIRNKNFVTPFKDNLSREYPASVSTKDVAEFYSRGNPLQNKSGIHNISSDFSYLYHGKVGKETLDNLFNFRLPKHQKKLRTALNSKRDMFPFTYKSRENIVTFRNANELINSADFKKGHWELLEDARVVEAIQQNNFSGSIVTEMYTTNGVPTRLPQLHLYDGSLVTDLKLVQDTLPNMVERLMHLNKNKRMWQSAVDENPTEASETQLRKIKQAIKFIENLIVKQGSKNSPNVSQSIAYKNLELRKKKLEKTLEDSEKVVDINVKSKIEDLERGMGFVDIKTDDLDNIAKAKKRYDAGLDAGKLPEDDPRLGEGNVRNLFPRNIDEVDE